MEWQKDLAAQNSPSATQTSDPRKSCAPQLRMSRSFAFPTALKRLLLFTDSGFAAQVLKHSPRLLLLMGVVGVNNFVSLPGSTVAGQIEDAVPGHCLPQDGCPLLEQTGDSKAMTRQAPQMLRAREPAKFRAGVVRDSLWLRPELRATTERRNLTPFNLGTSRPACRQTIQERHVNECKGKLYSVAIRSAAENNVARHLVDEPTVSWVRQSL